MELKNKFESQTFQIFFCFVLYKAERLIVETYFNLVNCHISNAFIVFVQDISNDLLKLVLFFQKLGEYERIAIFRLGRLVEIKGPGKAKTNKYTFISCYEIYDSLLENFGMG